MVEVTQLTRIVDVGDGNDLHVARHRRVTRQVLARDLARADEPDADRVGHAPLTSRRKPRRQREH